MKAHELSVSQRGRDVPASPIRRLYPYADEACRRGIEVLHLNIGQPDIKTPEPIMNAIREFDEPVLSYSPSPGYMSLREAICGYFQHQGTFMKPDQVLVTTGGSEALLFALAAGCDPGDEVLVPEPFYANYLSFATLLSVKCVSLPTTIDEGFHLPPRHIITDYITERTRAILFSSPGNPTGAVYSRQEMEMLAEIALTHGLFLISDEVYREFIYDPAVDFTSVLDFPELSNQAILIDSISKRFSSCGARIGCLVTANEAVLASVHKFAQARLSSPTVEQKAAEAGYRMDPSYFEPIRHEYRLRRDTLTSGLQEIGGVELHLPEGAFYLMVRLPVDNAERFAIFLLSEFEHQGKTVMVAPANGFYTTPGKGEDEVRIAYVLNRERLEKSVEIIDRALAVYREKTGGRTGVFCFTDFCHGGQMVDDPR